MCAGGGYAKIAAQLPLKPPIECYHLSINEAAHLHYVFTPMEAVFGEVNLNCRVS